MKPNKPGQGERPTRSRISAGLLLYRRRAGQLEVFLAHPGGPLFTKKDAGHWTIPKGEVEPGEDLLETALREVEEEVGITMDRNRSLIPLQSIQQKGGKIVHAWGMASDHDDTQPLQSNLFELEWPPGSGKAALFPEVDRAQFFTLPEARLKIKPTQIPLLDRLEQALQEEP